MGALARSQSPVPVARTDRVRLGMTQLSPFGLSEQWLLRDCGDRHWALIAEALGQAQATFQDASGHPIYAAFCATSIELAPKSGTLLGEEIEISSTLFKVSQSRIGSHHLIRKGSASLAELQMITCFVSHDVSKRNHRLVRNGPRTTIDLPLAPLDLLQLDAAAASARRSRHCTSAPAAPTARVMPVPVLDFNAVGLLYFPSFSRFAESAAPLGAKLRRRQVFYLGNLDPGEEISVYAAADHLSLKDRHGRRLALVRNELH